MSARRLLGYVVKLPDGTRSPRTQKPVPLADIVTPWLSGGAAEPHVVVPVFATRKPKPAPVAAAEGRYAVLSERGPRAGFQGWGPVSDEDFIGPREQAMRVALVYGMSVVRILPDGAFEAAVEAARREERERVLQELRGTLVQCCVDFAEDEAHAGGLAHAVRCLEDLIAAKKGQAK